MVKFQKDFRGGRLDWAPIMCPGEAERPAGLVGRQSGGRGQWDRGPGWGTRLQRPQGRMEPGTGKELGGDP